MVISGPINFLGSNLKIRLSIVNNNNVFEATYQVVSIPFVSLMVTFRELDGRLIVNDDLQNAHFVKRIVYQPIADRFVSDGAYAIEQFIELPHLANRPWSVYTTAYQRMTPNSPSAPSSSQSLVPKYTDTGYKD